MHERAARLADLAARLLRAPAAYVVLDGDPMPAAAALLAVPLTGGDGKAIGTLAVTDDRPRRWTDEDLDVLRALAAPIAAELLLARLSAAYDAERTGWQLAVDAAGVGAFDWDLRTGELRWDARLLELLDTDPQRFGGTIGDFEAAVHPEDLPRVRQALRAAIDGPGTYAAEFRVVSARGVRWVSARGQALRDAGGRAIRMIGAAYDSTAVREGEARVARTLESMPIAFFTLDRQWRFTHLNAEGERLLGHSRDELVGGVVWTLFPDARGTDFERQYRIAMERGTPVAFDAYYPPPLAAWYDVRAWPTSEGLSVYFLDVTARRRAQEELERQVRRSSLLTQVSTELSGSFEVDEAVMTLAGLVVRDLADWCVVTLREDRPGQRHDWSRGHRDAGWAHVDPAQAPLVRRYAETRVPSLLRTSFLAAASQTGRTAVVERDACRAVQAVLAPGEARDLCGRLAPESALVVPLPGRSSTVGLLSAFRGSGRPPFDAADVATLEDVGRRAGLALDNARLFAQQRELAEGLGRSMRPVPPEHGGYDVAVRAGRPGPEPTAAPGWHDAFARPDGSVVLVVGRVVDHRSEAVAAVGQLRSAMRAVAVHSAGGPAGILAGVSGVMASLQPDVSARVLLMVVEPAGEGHRLRWCSAGGGSAALVTSGSGPVRITGAMHGAPLVPERAAIREEGSVLMQPGSAVLLSGHDDPPWLPAAGPPSARPSRAPDRDGSPGAWCDFLRAAGDAADLVVLRVPDGVTPPRP